MVGALKPRWSPVTLDRAVVGLLVVECLLWLSERFQWFAFNHHKGWTVLIAMMSVGVAILGMLLWLLAAVVFRWSFRFSIRSLLVLTVVVAMACGWLAWERDKARGQKMAVDVLVNSGGAVGYDYEPESIIRLVPPQPIANPPGPEWLRSAFGDDFLFHVTYASLSGAQVTDVELEQLERLKRLKLLWLSNSQVTDAEVDKLRRALPKVQIHRLTIDPFSD